MSQSKKTMFITFIKFLITKVKPPCAKKTKLQSREEIETKPRWSLFFEDSKDQDRLEMNENEIDMDSQQSELLVTLPDHLIFDHILSRLPVNSLLRFKSVSKLWFSAISHTEFAKSHLQCSSSRSQFLLFEDYDSTDKLHMHLLHFDGYIHNVKNLFRLPFIDGGGYPAVDLVGSCNGLICLFLMELSGSFLVWNPSICQYRYVPDPYHQELITGYGFGYVPSIDDYKIIASYSSVLDRETGCFFVYSAKAGKWKRISSLDRSPYAGELTRFRGVCIGDTLYWPIRHSKVNGIVGFNLHEEQLKELPRMDWLNEYDNVVIFDKKGCLSLCCYKCDEASDVWMLKQHGEKSCWEMIFSVDLKGMSILNFSKSGKCLVHHKGKFMVLDPSEEAPDKYQAGIDFYGQIMETCHYVDTFIPPFGLAYYGGLGRGR